MPFKSISFKGSWLMFLDARTCSVFLFCLPPSQRSACHRYAYDEYTWNADGSKYSKYNENLIPSRIPMSVFISG